MSKKILISGGAGYIGAHVAVELFEAGFDPIIVDNFSNSHKNTIEGIEKISGRSITVYEGDCNDKYFMESVFEKEKEISGVIHFAAFKAVGESILKPLKYYGNNLGSLIVLLEVMKKFEVKNIVFSSSATVYGQPDQLPITENTPLKPAESPYGTTKLMCEKILEDAVNAPMPFKVVALRYFNPIGAHPSGLIGELPLGVPNNLVPFLTQTAAGIHECLTVFGSDYDTPDGTCVRDYIHVVDLAKAHLKSFDYLNQKSETQLYDVFNIGTGHGNTVKEVIDTFESVTGVKLNYKMGDRRVGDVHTVYANVGKAKKELHWEAKISLKESMADSWRWQKNLK